MSTAIFINLPVSDLPRARKFWTELGFSFNETFSNEEAAALVISEHINVMLLVEKHFKEFTTKEIADTATTAEAIFALSAESRARVDELADLALASGASPSNEPQDHGFMYGRSFADPDGHLWELVWMDPNGFPEGE
ncbi:VOC family protein [Amycolatopsis nigrescens]|uniref:VOC family protein n=1 Tax=Amycolatopsis nigrescens TaxID=381445 RepID=UPI00035EBBE5|nr:VOC family protein [Amycolatopsis nigrescens]